MEQINLEYITRLYIEYGSDLARVRDEQRDLHRNKARPMKAQLDDLEAEITYLLLRDISPKAVVEIGTFHGWSTTWILRALGDNDIGHLHSFDIVDHAVRNVPDDLAMDRWTLNKGDVRRNRELVPDDTDYLFIDAAHTASFARWYIAELFPGMPAKIPVSVHDVFHGRRALPFTEGATVLHWLDKADIPFFTASAAKAPNVHRQLNELKSEIGLDKPVRTSRNNPMIFFRLP